jgi:hypothetical protein
MCSCKVANKPRLSTLRPREYRPMTFVLFKQSSGTVIPPQALTRSEPNCFTSLL